ncbi:hypothetical protein GPY51_22805 [Photorhabdus laumondii subsp. laumondii]|uniref:Uncharacterized protein n=1 Tax=Photorhabdus laumondii subsp. laumondii TaxID=141679 RepID=A0A6L9JUK8_PHOLM|nr:hypothetical protein [Photorhabdus laumondii]MCC8414812.1 hypothetical protein [Photorhabdus laumondii]NDK97112.1 hypothetical protein [Photorhabdus laumondii subsp. laumondii]NDL21936.1 hypothetical protein [Photorhabdus laumondii subsp. laumondii]NDL31317.1 hypothetical protein [Photorhabdus laumondii subsp. laumondii]NDL34229.1 hypothetical protein [Photorhabdus laumondii subsp. laumondii]
MKPKKIDYSRFYADGIISGSGIDDAFSVHTLPAYVVSRHGRSYKRQSRSSAINKLAHIMTQKVFSRAGRDTNYPVRPMVGENNVVNWTAGESLPEYIECHNRAVRRIRLLLKRRKEIDALRIKYIYAFGEYERLRKEFINATK